jgi:hypothetical protein
MVIGGRRTARADEHGKRAARRGADHLLVDPRPDRVEGDQPVEEVRLLRQPAGEPLVQVVVGVDQTGGDKAAARVDPLVDRGQRGRRPRAHLSDAPVRHHDMAGRVLGAGTVHSGHRAALDHQPHQS